MQYSDFQSYFKSLEWRARTVAGVLIAALVFIPISLNRVRRKLAFCMEANQRVLTEGTLPDGV